MKYLLDYTDNFLCSTEAKVIKIEALCEFLCQKLCILVSYTFALSDFIKSKIASNTKPEQKKTFFTHLVNHKRRYIETLHWYVLCVPTLLFMKISILARFLQKFSNNSWKQLLKEKIHSIWKKKKSHSINFSFHK